MKKAYYGLLTFAIMSLSYDLYYWNMCSAVRRRVLLADQGG